MLSVLNLLILQLFFCWSIQISMTLPITSKPIDNTPENLAYLEFLKLGTLNQDKNRRVSPKSIFVVPQRIKNNSFEHPPTVVHINRDEILIAQLTNLLHNENKFGAQPSISYEYDYDYGEDAGGGGTKLNNPVSSPFIGNEEIVPSETQKQIEPLKVQIFFDKYPITIEGTSKDGENLDVAESNNSNNFWLVTNATATTANTKVESIETTAIVSENIGTTTTRAVTSQVFIDESEINLPANKATTTINDNYSDDYLSDTEGTTKINDNEMELIPPFVEIENKSDIKKSMVDESLLVEESVTGIPTILYEDSTETVDLLTATDQLEDQTDETTTKLPTNEWTTIQNWNIDDRFEQSTTDLSETILSTIRTPSEDTTILNTESQNANNNNNNNNNNLITTIPTVKIPKTINDLNKSITKISTTTTTTTIKPNFQYPSDAKKLNNPIDLETDDTTTIIDTTQTNMASNKRFVYHHLSTSEKQTDLVKPQIANNYNFDEQMKIINRIVAENRKKNEQYPNTFYINQQQQKQSSLPPIFRAMSGKMITTPIPTTTSTTTTTTTTTKSPNQIESYWWLPSNWNTNQNGEKPMLLRFWSNVPGL